ncbi:hypothetical protein LCGC14_1816500 [marine sediment metagenome]|uniref:Uncharacterized protein n=1 Tax=marine sediment metagenome TaxID=412755 RepID=A0A0F9J000_9ZZZZ
MHLLPNEQQERIQEALETLEKTGSLNIFEPCDCGNQICHNNGGNYHNEIYLRRDNGKMFVKYATTCELVEPAEWEECQDPESIVKENSDWL